MAERTLILGGPGCGKTTRLMDVLEEELAAGVPASQIAYVAFTKAAAEEAKARAAERFSVDPKRDLPWFRTIHSMAYMQLNCHQDDMMGSKDWAVLARMLGDPSLMEYHEADGPLWTADSDMNAAAMLRIVDFARATQQEVRAVWASLEDPGDWHQLERFCGALGNYKAHSGKREFADLLQDYITQNLTARTVRVAIIDEAQDLTAAQWAVVRQAFAGAERWYIAGDDDQAIYHWAGADVQTFLRIDVTRCEVLPITHRLPRAVFAMAQQIAGRIAHRYTKPYQVAPNAASGRVEHWQDMDDVPWCEGSWLCIARHRYLLDGMAAWARRHGLVYARPGRPTSVPREHQLAILGWTRWNQQKPATAEQVAAMHKLLPLGPRGPLASANAKLRLNAARSYLPQEAPREMGVPAAWLTHPWYAVMMGIPEEAREYYRSVLRRKRSITSAPTVRIDTIHGVKGAEADHVLLLTDQTGRTVQGMLREPDHEHRVFYVGCTRAKASVQIVAPQGADGYSL